MTATINSRTLLPMVEDDEKKQLTVRYPEFAKRLRDAMAEARPQIEIKHIAKALSTTYEMARRYTLGYAKPRDEKMEKLAEMVGKSSSYLTFGDQITEQLGEIQKLFQQPRRLHAEQPAATYGEDVRELFDKNVKPVPGGRRIPVISAVQAGRLTEITDPYPPGAGSDVIIAGEDLSPWAFALEIEGLSMAPEFNPGDRVVIEPQWQPRPGEYVVAKNGKEEATFKKYMPRGMDANGNIIFELAPLNPDPQFKTLRSDQEPLQIIGVMAEHHRRSRSAKKF